MWVTSQVQSTLKQMVLADGMETEIHLINFVHPIAFAFLFPICGFNFERLRHFLPMRFFCGNFHIRQRDSLSLLEFKLTKFLGFDGAS